MQRVRQGYKNRHTGSSSLASLREARAIKIQVLSLEHFAARLRLPDPCLVVVDGRAEDEEVKREPGIYL